MDMTGRLAVGADDFIVVLMTDQDNAVSLLRISNDLDMDLRHKRAGCVDDSELPPFRVFANIRRNAVGAEDGNCSVRYFAEGIDEDGSAGCQLLDDETIMNDFF